MEESPSPPPVPPKDSHDPYQTTRHIDMDLHRPSTAPASGSKRKREYRDENTHDSHNNADFNVTRDQDDGTPAKRSRPHIAQGEDDDDDYSLFDDGTPMQQRNIRRKNGICNLSYLNLRHSAASQQLPPPRPSPPRESRFHEGSLNDKPSDEPPSVYTRFTRTASGNPHYVDELMSDYHEGMPTPEPSVEAAIEHEKAMIADRVAEINAEKNKSKTPGMFRFGSNAWTLNFHPAALWNRLWNDTKDGLTRQNMLDAERKARQKAEAEAKYAQLKSAGQFGLQPVTLQNDNDSQKHQRLASLGSQLRPSYENSGRDVNEILEPPRTVRGRLSRLHLRKPSLSSLTGTVKRTKSDFHLGASAANRESSTSLSPTKADFNVLSSGLRSSASKYDLKIQHRLSKRVSDLESKLNKARYELDHALAEASPAPKLGSKYERFTPVHTLRGSKFVPGALPTLPSERIVMAQLNSTQAPQSEEPRIHHPIDLSTAFQDIDEEDTLKPTRVESSSKRVDSLVLPNTDDTNPRYTSEVANGEHQVSRGIEVTDVQVGEASVESKPGTLPADETREATESAVQDSPDANQNGSDVSTKKPAKLKKRTKKAGDGVFMPGREDDNDDAEWDVAADINKKKRASTGSKPKSPQAKITKKKMSTVRTKHKSAFADQEVAKMTATHITKDLEMDDLLGSEDELAKARNSIDAEVQSLEPVYEEEENTATTPLKDEPFESTAAATPARFGHHAVRSRSHSPQKRPAHVEPGAEERMITRAANAAQKSRGSKSVSPRLTRGSSKIINVLQDTSNAPSLSSNGANGMRGKLLDADGTKHATKQTSHKKENMQWEWPDDVF